MAETETETKLYLFYILCTRLLQYVCFNTSQQIKNNMINLFFLIRSKQIYRDFILLKKNKLQLPDTYHNHIRLAFTN